MKLVKFLKKRDDDSVFNVKMDKNATTFDYGMPEKERKRRHRYRIQRFYKNQQARFERAQKSFRKIPRTKKKRFYVAQAFKCKGHFDVLLSNKKNFIFEKYMFFFKLLLKTRLKLF